MRSAGAELVPGRELAIGDVIETGAGRKTVAAFHPLAEATQDLFGDGRRVTMTDGWGMTLFDDALLTRVAEATR